MRVLINEEFESVQGSGAGVIIGAVAIGLAVNFIYDYAAKPGFEALKTWLKENSVRGPSGGNAPQRGGGFPMSANDYAIEFASFGFPATISQQLGQAAEAWDTLSPEAQNRYNSATRGLVN